MTYENIPQEKVRIYCKKRYYALVHRQVIILTASRYFIPVLLITCLISIFFIPLFFFIVFPKNLFLLIPYPILSYFLYNHHQKIKKNSLSYKENIIFRLCGTSNFIQNYLTLESNISELNDAKLRNSFLIQELSRYTSFLNTYETMGLRSEENLIRFSKILKNFAETHVRDILEGIRIDSKLLAIENSYRYIAYLVDMESFSEAEAYILKNYILNESKPKWSDRISKFLSSNLARHILSGIIVFIGLISIYIYARYLGILTDNLIGPYFIAGLMAFITFSEKAKIIIDNITDPNSPIEEKN